ncbi:MAG: hypothetical protein Q8N03_09340 [Ignavibacteria bacterium]|nr:hypothetical protein [Ignavibacteria bacterium]
MRNRIFFIVLILIGLSLHFGCKKNDNPVNSEGTLGYFTGKVVDENGNAVIGAKIHAIPNVLQTSTLEKITSINEIIEFQFSLQQTSIVNLILLRRGTSDTVAVVIQNQEMPAGVHSIFFETTELTAGVYTMKLEYGNERIENNLILLKEISELTNANPTIITKEDGKFILPNKLFSIGVSFIRTSGISPDSIGAITVTNNVTFLIMKEGFKNLQENITIDTTIASLKLFTLQKN